MTFNDPRQADVTKIVPGEMLVRSADLEWRQNGPKMETKILRVDEHNGTWVQLDRYKKGGRVMRHIHKAPIEGYVLSGKFQYRGDRYFAGGDYMYEPLGALHPEATALEDTIIFSVIYGPIEFIDDDNKTIMVVDWEWVMRQQAGLQPPQWTVDAEAVGA